MDTVDRTQIDLNNELYLACTTLPVDYGRIESLLQQGAQPLGIIIPLQNVSCHPRYFICLYEQVIGDYITEYRYEPENSNGDELYNITKLFLKHGMNLSQPVIPYNEHVFSNPANMLAFAIEENFLPVLQLLLDVGDAGLDLDSVGEYWGLQYHDLYMLAHTEEDAYCAECENVFRNLLFFASYPHIWTKDKNLREVLGYTDDEVDPLQLNQYRQWDKYNFMVECGHYEHNNEWFSTRITVTEKDTHSNQQVFYFNDREWCIWDR